jgi:hypothetical protein
MHDTPEGQKTALSDAMFYALLLVLAEIASYSLWAGAVTIDKYLAYAFRGLPQAPLTTFFFQSRSVLLLFPAPWLLFAVYSLFRGPRSFRTLLYFSSTLILAQLTLSTVAALAFMIPFIFIPGGRGQ